LLRAALAIDLTNPIPVRRGTSTGWLQHSWKEAVFQHRPDLARDAYVAVARAKLQRGDQLVDGLRELLTQEALAPFRQEITLEFLRDYPNANTFQLDELLRAVLPISAAHAEFLVLASRVLSGAVTVDEPQRDRWLATAYVLSPSQYEAAVKATAQVRPGLVFELRNRTGFSRNMQGNESVPPPLPMLAILARLTGSLYPEVGFPSGGWSGDTNAWDAAEYCRSLINAISAVPSEAATDALTRLAADPQLSSYRPHLLHALANQRERRREAEYDRPDWPQTVKALSNGSPATVADLHALLVAHLEELRKRIASENTDIYKSFWNLDGYARPVDPRPEEACRDTLVTLLRPRLAPLGITVEPEGHMVADKRADISVAMPARKILCELKRDYHAEVWAAAEEQLERYYTHDPDAQGFGIYAVFWFGDKRLFEIPKPPGGLARPVSAAELENMLRAIVPADRANRIAVLVIDVSGPPHP